MLYKKNHIDELGTLEADMAKEARDSKVNIALIFGKNCRRKANNALSQREAWALCQFQAIIEGGVGEGRS